MMLSIMRRRYSLLAKEEERVFKSSSWCWRDRERLARCSGGIWRGGRGVGFGKGKVVCTNLAVEGARVGNIF